MDRVNVPKSEARLQLLSCQATDASGHSSLLYMPMPIMILSTTVIYVDLCVGRARLAPELRHRGNLHELLLKEPLQHAHYHLNASSSVFLAQHCNVAVSVTMQRCGSDGLTAAPLAQRCSDTN